MPTPKPTSTYLEGRSECKPVHDSISSLDLVPISCEGPGTVLSEWILHHGGCSAGDRMFELSFFCKTANAIWAVRTDETECNVADQNLEFLDRHNVACADGEAMTGFR